MIPKNMIIGAVGGSPQMTLCIDMHNEDGDEHPMSEQESNSRPGVERQGQIDSTPIKR